MRTAILGDTHGRDDWKQILLLEKWDRVVFLGDYFDTHDKAVTGEVQIAGEAQIANFLDIVEYKKQNPETVTLLFGNHDYHYINPNGMCSGYNHLFAKQIAAVINNAITFAALQMAHLEQGWLCTHAGVTKAWCDKYGIDATVDSLNHYALSADVFSFYPGDYTGYGDHILQSPIWVRPGSLFGSMATEKQIVGHTRQKQMVVIEDTLVLNDTIGVKKFCIIEDGKPVEGSY